MRQVLEALASGHFSWHLVLLIFLVFIATPLLKHAMFKRGRRNGSVYQPPRKFESSEEQEREARLLLRDQKRKKAGKPPIED
jgi:hypothetical protein